jgi:hypothetical protein
MSIRERTFGSMFDFRKHLWNYFLYLNSNIWSNSDDYMTQCLPDSPNNRCYVIDLADTLDYLLWYIWQTIYIIYEIWYVSCTACQSRQTVYILTGSTDILRFLTDLLEI